MFREKTIPPREITETPALSESCPPKQHTLRDLTNLGNYPSLCCPSQRPLTPLCHSERSRPCALRMTDAVEESLPSVMTMRERKTYFVYIVGSLSGTLYIGITSRPGKRIWQHKQRVTGGFTSRYDVDRLLYWESYDDVRKAIDRERQFKGWRREKKIQLIRSLNPQWLDLSKRWYEAFMPKGRDASTTPARTQVSEQLRSA